MSALEGRLFLPFHVCEGPPLSSEVGECLVRLRDLGLKVYKNLPSFFFAPDRVRDHCEIERADCMTILEGGNKLRESLFDRLRSEFSRVLSERTLLRPWNFFYSAPRGVLPRDTDLFGPELLENWHVDHLFQPQAAAAGFFLWVPDARLASLELIGDTNRPGNVLCARRFCGAQSVERLLARHQDLEVLRFTGNKLFALPDSCVHRRQPIDYTQAQGESYGFRGDYL